jgi:hypothetical protein
MFSRLPDADVKLAIDGKQPTLTGFSNITTGISASNIDCIGYANIAGYYPMSSWRSMGSSLRSQVQVTSRQEQSYQT